MDIEKLKLLKTKANDQSILIVEDCNLIQKQISTFLNKFFKDVHQAFDGEEGVVQYRKHHPSIIVTDLSMPKKGGLDMIREIKIIGDHTKFIIFTAHNEEEILMDTIKLKVDHFLLKPLNIDKFIDTLLLLLSDEEVKPTNKYTECLHALEFLFKQKGHVRLVNYFNDVMIEQEGEITSIIEDTISIKIPHIQILAIDHDGNTIIELKSIKKFMKFRLLKIDKVYNTIYVSKPMYIDYELKDSSNKQYFYDSKFTIGLHKEHKFFTLNVLDISQDTITMFIDDVDTELTVTDQVNITISLVFDDKKENKDIYARGKLTAISRYREGLRVIATMEIENKDKVHFKKYITKIENEIIKELTNEENK